MFGIKTEKLVYPGSLHNHTDYSNLRLRDSVNTIETLIDRALSLNQEVVAITEHETVASAVKAEKYYQKIKKNNPNFKVILGNEIYLCRNGLNSSNFIKGKDKLAHFILLAKNARGHEQIREISTRAWTRSYLRGRQIAVPTYYQDLKDIIQTEKGNVIGSTACLGSMLSHQLLNYRDSNDEDLYRKIKLWVKQIIDIFGKEDFYLEMQPSKDVDQLYVNKKLIEFSKEFDLKLIITTDSHYLSKDDRAIHKAFLKAQNGEREVDAFYETTYLMDHSELKEYMGDYIDDETFAEIYNNIIEIKNKCEDYSLLKPLNIPRLKWKVPMATTNEQKYVKSIQYLKKFLESNYESDRILASIIIETLENDDGLQTTQTYSAINDNLEKIWLSSEKNNTRWSRYFLNLQNIIDLCWEAGSIVGVGRGSGVGFFLLYLLGITQINPLKEKTKTFSWRFLNPDRVSVLDVDCDIESNKRKSVLNLFREKYGQDRVANVVTFGTEKSKSAIMTAGRGINLDSDISQYISSLIPSDRGEPRTLTQCYYGDQEKGMKPIPQFVRAMTDDYPHLWEVAQRIEGLVKGMGIHAGGVIFVDEPFTKTTALLKGRDGTTAVQYELHDAEAVGLIKYDILSIKALDKIHTCLDLLIDANYIKEKETLKETYESTVGVYNLERNNIDMWEMVWGQEIESLFQLEAQSGIQGIATMKPNSVDDLSTLNAAIRLMAQEKGGEMPIDKLARFKRDDSQWNEELKLFGLSEKEKKILEPIIGISYGLCILQEQFMQLVQLPELGDFDLVWADKLRKAIAKKSGSAFDELEEEYFKVIQEKKCDEKLCKYVWQLIKMSKGYGFNASHTLAYSLIALQEMNLAHRFPIMFWNCACLINECGGEDENIDEENEENTEIESENFDTDIEEFDDEEDEENELEKETKKKKKAVIKNYGKIATAIGKMVDRGIIISPPNINLSSYTFSPDPNKNTIYCGLMSITGMNKELAAEVISNRPYSSLIDFISKIKLNKPKTINLIKSGAFDNFGTTREEIMQEYIYLISEPKSTLNLRNMAKLIEFKLLPLEFDLIIKIFNFNKYIKKFKVDTNYLLNDTAFTFYEKHFDIDLLQNVDNDNFLISKTVWDKIYTKSMKPVKDYIKDNLFELLEQFNLILFQQLWNKYCLGSISKWEMDAISFYNHQHELEEIKKGVYGESNFFALPETPEIEYTLNIKGKEVPIMKLTRIMGTVLDKNKSKHLITLLTTTGVVTVMIYGAGYSTYDKQISVLNEKTGKKKIVEKSWFTKGNKLIINGVRTSENKFVAKKYKKTTFPLVEKIIEIKNDGYIITQKERIEV